MKSNFPSCGDGPQGITYLEKKRVDDSFQNSFLKIIFKCFKKSEIFLISPTTKPMTYFTWKILLKVHICFTIIPALSGVVQYANTEKIMCGLEWLPLPPINQTKSTTKKRRGVRERIWEREREFDSLTAKCSLVLMVAQLAWWILEVMFSTKISSSQANSRNMCSRAFQCLVTSLIYAWVKLTFPWRIYLIFVVMGRGCHSWQHRWTERFRECQSRCLRATP